MPSKAAIQVIVSLVVAIALAVGATIGVQQIMRWRAGALQNEARGQTMSATHDVMAIGDRADEARRTADQGTATARDTFNNTVQEDSSNEPETAHRDAGVVPASRLRAFHNRRLERERLARDRLGRAGVQREEGPGSKDASER